MAKKSTRRKTSRKATKTTTKQTKASKAQPMMNTSQILEQARGSITKFFSSRQNTTLVLVLLILAALLYLFKGVFVVAMVNGQPVYRWTVVSQLEEQGGRQVLDSLVTESLVRQEVRRSGVTVDQAELDTSVAEIEDRLAAQGLTLDQALEQEGMTRAELVDDLRLQLAVDQLLEDQINVTEEEIDQYIENNSEFLPEDMEGEELREYVRAQLNSQEMSGIVQAWIQGLQEEANIVYFKDYGGLAF